MSKKDQERAERTGLVHRDGKLVQRQKCPIPECTGYADPKSKFAMCSDCDRIARALLWMLPRVKKVGAEPEPQGPVLLVPKPGMEKQAIDEAKKAGQKIAIIGKGGP